MNLLKIYENILATNGKRIAWNELLSPDVKIKVITLVSNKSPKLLRQLIEPISNIFDLHESSIRPHIRKFLKTLAREDSKENEFFYLSDYFKIYDALDINTHGLFILKKKSVRGESFKTIEFFDSIDMETKVEMVSFFDGLIPRAKLPCDYNKEFVEKLNRLEKKYHKYPYLSDISRSIELKNVLKLIRNVVKTYDIDVALIQNTSIYDIMFRMEFSYYTYRNTRAKRGVDATINFYESVIAEFNENPFAFLSFVKFLSEKPDGDKITIYTICLDPKLDKILFDGDEQYYRRTVNRMEELKRTFFEELQVNKNLKELYNRIRNENKITNEHLMPRLKIFRQISVYVVETINHFNKALEWLQNAKMIAVDTEFSTDSICGKLHLCQVAVMNGVILFDAVKIPTHNLCWKKLMNLLIVNPLCPVLFFDFKNDFRILGTILNDEEKRNLDTPNNRVIDIQFLYSNSIKEPTFRHYLEGECAEPIDTKSLFQITRNVLNIDIDKQLQCAAWKMRPLRNELLEYAAIDAYILILIYNKIKSVIQDDELFSKLEGVIDVASYYKLPSEQVEGSVDETKKIKGGSVKKVTLTDIINFIKNDPDVSTYTNSPKQFTFYVDSMILNMQPVLLNLGFNIFTNVQQKCKIERNQDVIILSVGKTVANWRSQNRYNKIIDIKYDHTLQEKVLSIFKELKVALDESLIVPKCSKCYSDSIVVVNRKFVLLLSYEDFKEDPEYTKQVTRIGKIDEVTILNDLMEDIGDCKINPDEGIYYAKEYKINYKLKHVMFYPDEHWRALPDKRQLFLRAFHNINDFMLCRNCNSWSSHHTL
uniref:3'-5' exonuclease domain-containing protein n=1 Tax=Parastrongyloides trichosuri TaxID=131310 RepID=A0A0N4ZK69_PARTI